MDPWLIPHSGFIFTVDSSRSLCLQFCAGTVSVSQSPAGNACQHRWKWRRRSEYPHYFLVWDWNTPQLISIFCIFITLVWNWRIVGHCRWLGGSLDNSFSAALILLPSRLTSFHQKAFITQLMLCHPGLGYWTSPPLLPHYPSGNMERLKGLEMEDNCLAGFLFLAKFPEDSWQPQRNTPKLQIKEDCLQNSEAWTFGHNSVVSLMANTELS